MVDGHRSVFFITSMPASCAVIYSSALEHSIFMHVQVANRAFLSHHLGLLAADSKYVIGPIEMLTAANRQTDRPSRCISRQAASIPVDGMYTHR